MRPIRLLALALALAAAALSACKQESVEGPLASCQPVTNTLSCRADADCCSFGCVFGVCRPNPVEGGVCRTHSDCLAPRLCIEERCTGNVQCLPGGASCGGLAPCCSGVCALGVCQGDQAPVAVPGLGRPSPVPIRVPLQLTNASYDPDVGVSGVGLSYAWAVTARPTGSLAGLYPDASYPTPTFTPDVPGSYTIRLVASNFGGASAPASVTFSALNTVPTADVDPDVAASRNVALRFTARVSDLDGGPVRCTWSKIPPLPAAQDPVVIGTTTLCAAASGGAATGTTEIQLSEDAEGTWTVRLTTEDDLPANRTTVTRFIDVRNDAPRIEAMPQRVGNFGPPGGVAPPIRLRSVVQDVNQDVERGNVTWSWKLTATKPGAEPRAAGDEIGTTPDVDFVPSAAGAYQIRLDVDDHHTGGTATAFVDVLVEPYILPLGAVAGAVHHKNSNRVVAVGTAAGGAPRLWVVDPDALTTLHVVALAAAPTCVAISDDGATALVGEQGGWQVVSSVLTAPAAGPLRPFQVSGVNQSTNALSIAHVTAPNLDVRGYATDTGGKVFELFLDAVASPFSNLASCPSCNATTEPPRGRYLAASPTTLWTLDPSDGRLGRYSVSQSNFNLTFGAASVAGTLSGSKGLWLGSGAAHLFTATRGVYAADTLAQAGLLATARDHLDTTNAGGLKGVSTATAETSLRRFDAALAADTGAVPLPQLGRNGTGYPTHGFFSFVKFDESFFYAVVRADTGAGTPSYEWGLVKLAP